MCTWQPGEHPEAAILDEIESELDKDEAVAVAATGTAWAWEATGDKDNSWAVGHVEDDDGHLLSGEIGHGQGIVIDGVCESINGNLADAAHIARQDPGRTLRKIRAMRAVMRCVARMDDQQALADLTAAWRDHPDYP